MNIPDLYARVCAVRPELAVPMLKIDTSPPGWSLCGSWCGEHFTAALILARWVEALPELICIHKRSYGWVVGRGGSAHSCPPPLIAPTPIEALAAFYLGEKA